MIRRFLELCEQPELYPVVEQIDKNYRRSVYGSHSIYYRALEGEIIITRILGRQDLAKAF
ncbi:type II toxin-antitoxin system RelE/ParE family toxin [Kiloniella antarctica]|uniref:Type II toxin-antitoxin system RelE/ParE family toxin n=1 Tax=Kiloniella antarctica TaxID=1550907 RepID=A0ABW5BLL9_9PROT